MTSTVEANVTASSIQPAGNLQKKETMASASGSAGNLPYADGMTFKTLDDYLVYRKKQGAADRPYYEEVSPGVYRLISGRRLPRTSIKTYTRQQLLEKFGFKD